MDTFSLEDDCDELFITQSSSSDSQLSKSTDNGVENEFRKPLVSLLDSKYSDIFDDDFEIPCSQKRPASDLQDERFVY